MGLGGWRVKKQMKRPDRGVFQVTQIREAHHGVHVTGIITAPGVRPTVVEHKAEDGRQWAGVHKVPVMVDLADPSKFEVLWYELESGWSEDDELPQRPDLNPYQPTATVSFTSTVVTTGPDGRTISTNMSPEAAAHMQAVLSEALGQGGLLGKAKGMRAALNEIRNQALGQEYGQPGGYQAQGFPPGAQDFLPQGTGPQGPGMQGFPPPTSQGWAPPPEAQGFGPPPEAQGFGPPPEAQGFGPPPEAQGFGPPPDNQAFPTVDPREWGPSQE
jgi:hypothetical protein